MWKSLGTEVYKKRKKKNLSSEYMRLDSFWFLFNLIFFLFCFVFLLFVFFCLFWCGSVFFTEPFNYFLKQNWCPYCECFLQHFSCVKRSFAAGFFSVIHLYFAAVMFLSRILSKPNHCLEVVLTIPKEFSSFFFVLITCTDMQFQKDFTLQQSVLKRVLSWKVTS